jgi:hypothetical protein
MLGGRPCPSPPSRPTGEGDENLCVRGPEGSDEMPKRRGGARPGAGRPRRPRKPPGRPPHVPTEESRRFVGALVTTLNLNHEQVAAVMGLNAKTLRKHYRPELKEAKLKIDIAVHQTFVAKCLGGTGAKGDPHDWRKADTKALIWYTKARMGWTDKADVGISGDVTIKLGPEYKDI